MIKRLGCRWVISFVCLISFLSVFTAANTTTDTLTRDEIIAAVKRRLDEKNPRAASSLVEKGLKIYPDDAYLWFLKGTCAKQQENLKTAAQALQRALELNPGLSKARFNLALLRSLPGTPDYNLPQAIADLEGLIKADPDFNKAYFYLGFFYRRHEKYDRAEFYLKKTLKHEPGRWNTYPQLARVYLARDRIDEAQSILNAGRKKFTTGVEWDRIELDVYGNWIKRKMRACKYFIVQPVLTRLLKRHADDKELIYLEGFIFQEKGAVENAERCYNTLLSDGHYGGAVRLNLARMYALEGIHLEKAGRYLKDVNKTLKKPTWEIQVVWMLIHIKQGKLSAARNNFNIASKLLHYFPQNPDESAKPENLPEDFQYAAALLAHKQRNKAETGKWLHLLNPNPQTALCHYVEALRQKL